MRVPQKILFLVPRKTEEMKNRILQLMRSKGMTQQEFSRATGISPASLSSIFTGRTAPTMKHAEAMHRFFPQLNVAWLLFGEGDMFKSIEDTESGEKDAIVTGGRDDAGAVFSAGMQDSGEGLFSGASDAHRMGSADALRAVRSDSTSSVSSSSPYKPNVRAREDISYPLNYPGMGGLVNYPDKKQRKIVEIRIFFDDGTFETFQGNS